MMFGLLLSDIGVKERQMRLEKGTLELTPNNEGGWRAPQ